MVLNGIRIDRVKVLKMNQLWQWFQGVLQLFLTRGRRVLEVKTFH